MKKLITDIKVGDSVCYFNSNWSTYYKGEVVKLELTKSGKSTNVTLRNALTRRDRLSGEINYIYQPFSPCSANEITLTIRNTVSVEE